MPWKRLDRRVNVDPAVAVIGQVHNSRPAFIDVIRQSAQQAASEDHAGYDDDHTDYAGHVVRLVVGLVVRRMLKSSLKHWKLGALFGCFETIFKL